MRGFSVYYSLYHCPNIDGVVLLNGGTDLEDRTPKSLSNFIKINVRSIHSLTKYDIGVKTVSIHFQLTIIFNNLY